MFLFLEGCIFSWMLQQIFCDFSAKEDFGGRNIIHVICLLLDGGILSRGSQEFTKSCAEFGWILCFCASASLVCQQSWNSWEDIHQWYKPIYGSRVTTGRDCVSCQQPVLSPNCHQNVDFTKLFCSIFAFCSTRISVLSKEKQAVTQSKQSL